MFIERFFVEGLAHASYLFGSEGEAAVVDPRRDVDEYIEAASRHGARIVAVFETHPHADFASGHVELAQRTGAKIYVSHLLAATYEHVDLRDGDKVKVGYLEVTGLETPGHSPDSMSFYVEGGETPWLFSGDVLFVGDVGRPDLRDATDDPHAMAEALYDTLNRFWQLPGATMVYPAHGAGSLCGRKIGGAPSTTIAAEREQNWATRFSTREEFAAAMTSNLPDRPHFFRSSVALNLHGVRPLAEVPRPRELTATEAYDLHERQPGAAILDVRPAAQWMQGHIAGSTQIGGDSPMFSTWTGFLYTIERPLILVADTREQVEAVWLDLARIGYERILGWTPARESDWARAGFEVTQGQEMEACELCRWPGRVLDVRTPGEWERGHVAEAMHIPLSQLESRLDEVPHKPLAVLCGSGYRSAIAYSLLEQAGHERMVNVRGGWGAYANCGCQEPDATDVTCPAPVLAVA